MSGLGQYPWETRDSSIAEAIKGKSLDFSVNKIFNEEFEQAITSRQQGVRSVIKHLVATLPLVDRENLEFAKLEFLPVALTHSLFSAPCRFLEEKSRPSS